MAEGLASTEEIATKIINAGAAEVRNVDAGEKPFIYSTGNRGPGYLNIKGLVSQRKVLKWLVRQLAKKVAPLYGEAFDFCEGNVSGGVCPSYQLADYIEQELGLEEGTIPYSYLRESRKEGGHGEQVTGRPPKGMKALIGEELVNFAGTTCNAALVYRGIDYPVSHASCIVHYDHAASNKKLEETGVTLMYVITVRQILDGAEATKALSQVGIDLWREFLDGPAEFQLRRGLVIPGPKTDEDLGKTATLVDRAISVGYQMRRLDGTEAIELGAPAHEIKKGTVYWAKTTDPKQ